MSIYNLIKLYTVSKHLAKVLVQDLLGQIVPIKAGLTWSIDTVTTLPFNRILNTLSSLDKTL